MSKIKTVSVALKDIQSNPFRQEDTAGLIHEKVEALKLSIQNTGFWENMIGREVDGVVQIAYGHHRLAAAKDVLGPDHKQPIHVKPLSDDDMLIIMADENSDDWANTLQHKRLVVSQARARLEDALDEFGSYVDFLSEFKHIPAIMRAIPDEASFEQFMEKDSLVGIRTVAAYLGWGKGRVEPIWDVIGLSRWEREFLADNIEQSEASGISTKLDKDDNYVDGEMGRLLDEAKSRLEVDDLWTPELLDKFETAEQARSVKAVALGDEFNRKTLFNSKAKVEKLVDDLVDEYDATGTGKVARSVSGENVRNAVRSRVAATERTEAQARKAQLAKRLNIMQRIKGDASALVTALRGSRRGLDQFIAFLKSSQMADDPEVKAVLHGVEQDIFNVIKTLDEYGFVTRYFDGKNDGPKLKAVK